MLQNKMTYGCAVFFGVTVELGSLMVQIILGILLIEGIINETIRPAGELLMFLAIAACIGGCYYGRNILKKIGFIKDKKK